MEVVYVLGKGSKWGDAELLLSLRSLANMTGVASVAVVGERPGWLTTEAVHVPATDPWRNNKQRCILHKALMWAARKGGGAEFLFMNDDLFITSGCAATWPHTYRGMLPERPTGTRYSQDTANTHRQLKERGLAVKDFDHHLPIVYNKEGLREAANAFDWRGPYGPVVKSMYCNWHRIEGARGQDCKRSAEPPEGWPEYARTRKCISTGDDLAASGAVPFLLGLYPSPSPFERHGQGEALLGKILQADGKSKAEAHA